MSSISETNKSIAAEYSTYRRKTVGSMISGSAMIIGAIILGVLAILKHLVVMHTSSNLPEYGALEQQGWGLFAGSMAATVAVFVSLGFFIYYNNERAKLEGQLKQPHSPQSDLL